MRNIGAVCVVTVLTIRLLLWCVENLDMLKMVGQLGFDILPCLLHTSIFQVK